MINYMDRLTLNQLSTRIMDAFALEEPEYGQIESAFAIAFALGAISIGWMVDRWNVWWIYPASVFAWSLAGFATGFADSFAMLLLCRFWLGLAEAGNWPCALRTTQRILPPEQRTMGNGILQSGAAVGAVLIPLIVQGLVMLTGTWRYPFLVVGGIGVMWVLLWFAVVRRADLEYNWPSEAQAKQLGQRAEARSLLEILADRRFWVLVILVVSINTAWHFFRAWMPLFLQRSHHYSEAESNLFASAYYLATDAGSLSAGFATLWLVQRGLSVHNSRVLVFFLCALLTALSALAAVLPSGPLLLVVLLIIGFGALGLFPNYYSFSQELTVRHQGKVTGLLGCINWMAMALLHQLIGVSIKETGSYALGMTLAGLAPLAGFCVLFFVWGEEAPRRLPEPHLTPMPVTSDEHLRPAADSFRV
jgi:ACS family hexuronate transporter-like MFS transporter